MSSNAKGSARRSIKSAQIGVRMIHFGFAGSGANTVSGLDRHLVDSANIVDGTNGLYTIPLKGKASVAGAGASSDLATLDIALAGYSSSTADCTVQVVAVTGSSIQVQCHVAGVAADADISLTLLVSDNRFQYEA